MLPSPEETTSCARILLRLTREWQPADGSAATLADARAALAGMIIELKGRGFPQPASDAMLADPTAQGAWAGCVSAALRAADGTAAGPFGTHVVFWSSDPGNPVKLGDAPGLGLTWPFSPGSRLAWTSGAILDGNTLPKRLFFFDQVDPAALLVDKDLSAGFWPKRSLRCAAGTSSRLLPQAAGEDRPRLQLATSLFTLWLVVGVAACAWIWLITLFASRSRPFTGEGWVTHWLWIPLKVDDTHYSLLLPFLVVMTSFLLLIVAAGLAVKGKWFGAVIDTRNRFSLSRAQQLAWSILLLGSLGTMGWFNATTGAADLSDLFPTMDAALWAALGINLAVSPFISTTILTIKDRKGQEQELLVLPAPSRGQPTIIVPAKLDRNSGSDEASWTNLLTGEIEGGQDQIDISRLQHLLISGVLLTTYFVEVAKNLANLQVGSPLTPFRDMPPAGATFIGLLVFSHAGYLIFKARKSPGRAPSSSQLG